MYTRIRTMVIATMLTGTLGALPSAHSADLKQLAEQLVNLTVPKEAPPQGGKSHSEIREIMDTKSAKRYKNPGRTHYGQRSIAIQEEGANVKKEKGVEDVE